MSENSKNPTEAAAGSQSDEARFEEIKGGPRFSIHAIKDAACDVQKQVEDAFMAVVPPEVTEHLVNSQKELVKAGLRLGERFMEDLDARTTRAREIHTRIKAEKAAGEQGA